MKSSIIFLQATILLIIMSFYNLNQKESGKETFEKNCAKCHGKDGSKKSFGVKSLQKSQLSSTETLEIITNGNGKMPNWKEKLSIQEIEQVTEYIDTLRRK